MSLGHNNQQAQRSPRVQGPQADQAVLDSQVVRKDPGCLACPAPGHLGGGRSGGNRSGQHGRLVRKRTSRLRTTGVTGQAWRSSGALDSNTLRSFLTLFSWLTWTHTHTQAVSHPDSPARCSQPGSGSVYRHLSLLVVRSVRSVLGSQVSPGVPVLPECPEFPVCQALLGVLAQCGWRLVDWERGSGWSCTGPCGLSGTEKDDRLSRNGRIRGAAETPNLQASSSSSSSYQVPT